MMRFGNDLFLVSAKKREEMATGRKKRPNHCCALGEPSSNASSWTFPDF